MATQSESDDPDAAMREMMGFSTFDNSGSKGRKKQNKDTVRVSQPHLTGSNNQPLSKRLKATPIPNQGNMAEPTNSASSLTDSRTKSTSPPPYIPPSMYPAHILPPKPTSMTMLDVTSPEPSPAHSTHSGISDSGPFRGVSAGPPLQQQDLPVGNLGTSPLPTPMAPEMTTYNAAFQPPGISSSTFVSQDARFAAPPALVIQAEPAPGVESPEAQQDTLARHSVPAFNPKSKQYARDGVSYMRKNEKGDTVFFKPSFIVDDPWSELRKSKEEGRVQERMRNR